MKKILIIVLILVLGVAGGFGVYYFTHTATATDYTQKEGVHFVGNSWYSRSELTWKKMKVEEEIGYDESLTQNIPIQTEYIYNNMFDDKYISLDLPSTHEYINELGSELKAKDGAFRIYTLAGDISSINVDIIDAKTNTKTTKYTDSTGKHTHTVVNYLDSGIVLIGEVYSNSTDWTFVRDAVLSVENYVTPYSNNVLEYKELPEANPEIIQSVFTTDEFLSNIVRFEDGYLYYQNAGTDFGSCAMTASTWLAAVGCNNDIRKYVNRDAEIYYGESQNGYCIGIVRNNAQYFYVLRGFGEEAKTNILKTLLK